MPPNFKGYVVYDINDYKNNWVSSEEDNNIDLSKTNIKDHRLNINANDVDVDSYLSFDNFFICGEGVTNQPGDIATTEDYVQLDASMFYGVDINSLDNISYRSGRNIYSLRMMRLPLPLRTTTRPSLLKLPETAAPATQNGGDAENAGFPHMGLDCYSCCCSGHYRGYSGCSRQEKIKARTIINKRFLRRILRLRFAPRKQARYFNGLVLFGG